MRAVLHTLQDRLTLEETAEFSAQLPMLIRGLFFEGWEPSRQPVKHNLDSFLISIEDQFRNEMEIDAEEVARAVFHVISKRIAAGEVKDLKAILPADLRSLWDSE